jgi:hypothetical protein
LWLEHQVVMLTTDRDGGRLVIATVGNWSRRRPISNSHRGKLLGTVFFTCADSMVDQRASDLEMAFVTALRQGQHPGRRRWFFLRISAEVAAAVWTRRLFAKEQGHVTWKQK